MPFSTTALDICSSRTFCVEEKKQFLGISRRFCGGFSDETNQGDGEMASIDGGLIRDLRFDSFQ